MFRKLLVANRGEIALRIIRACRELGISPVVLFVPEDVQGLWIEAADEVYELHGFSGRSGYLNVEAILDVARKARVQAVHPGYGFLSEQASFARACADAGFVFVGPSPKALEAAGHKVEARKLAEKFGLPVLPGTPPLSSWKEAEAQVKRVGFPALIKAAAGGGGRGMRLVRTAKDVREAFEAAQREAKASFGDDTIYFEKYVASPRHVEIQVMADQHGHAFYLGERECSIQRRYQKLVEESPSPAVDELFRREMGESALHFIKGIGYTGAGTVEFLLDENRNYYFLEMNARIQVEHPVTEMVAGLDLVKAQIEVAAGEKLNWHQEEIKINGCAIEARINCEDPSRNFLPSPGKVKELRTPGGPGIRMDTALYPGYEIPEAFDSLVAKLIAWGKNRDEAILRMRRALSEFRITGIETTIPFHLQLFNHPAFVKGDLSTHFIEDHLQSAVASVTEEEAKLAALVAALEAASRNAQALQCEPVNAWAQAGRTENFLQI